MVRIVTDSAGLNQQTKRPSRSAEGPTEQQLTDRALHPGQAERFNVGKALNRFLHTFFVTKSRVLNASEGGELKTIAGNLSDIHGTDLKLGDKPRNVVHAIGTDR